MKLEQELWDEFTSKVEDGALTTITTDRAEDIQLTSISSIAISLKRIADIAEAWASERFHYEPKQKENN